MMAAPPEIAILLESAEDQLQPVERLRRDQHAGQGSVLALLLIWSCSQDIQGLRCDVKACWGKAWSTASGGSGSLSHLTMVRGCQARAQPDTVHALPSKAGGPAIA